MIIAAIQRQMKFAIFFLFHFRAPFRWQLNHEPNKTILKSNLKLLLVGPFWYFVDKLSMKSFYYNYPIGKY
jgi:hypothetical protein